MVEVTSATLILNEPINGIRLRRGHARADPAPRPRLIGTQNGWAIWHHRGAVVQLQGVHNIARLAGRLLDGKHCAHAQHSSTASPACDDPALSNSDAAVLSLQDFFRH
jgi:hypothetical protein